MTQRTVLGESFSITARLHECVAIDDTVDMYPPAQLYLDRATVETSLRQHQVCS